MFNLTYFNKYNTLILIGLVLHCVSIFFGIGFYSDDEHFQILEPVAYLLNINNEMIDEKSGLYWEWKSYIRLRPLIQIYFYYFLIKPLEFLHDPFVWSFVIRFVSSSIGFISILYFFQKLKKNNLFEINSFNYFIYFCFWFYPFLHSRSSSENLGISLFVIGLAILYDKESSKLSNIKTLLASFIIGLAVAIKYTLIFGAAPLFIYFVFKDFKFKKILNLSGGFTLALALGTVLDSLFWGRYTNTYLQFYKYNIGKGVLNDFGIEPWWYYITETSLVLAPLLSVIFIISILFFWFKKPFNQLTLVTFFSVIILSFIGHKEIRYIFPVYIFAPIFIIYLLENISNKKFNYILKIILILSNILFLLITLFFPVNHKVGIYKYIYHNKNIINNIYYYGENPYQVNGMEPMFYTKFLKPIKKYDDKNYWKKDSNHKNNKRYWVVTNEYDYIEKKLSKCNLKYSTLPKTIYSLNKNWKRLKLNWQVYYCKNTY